MDLLILDHSGITSTYYWIKFSRGKRITKVLPRRYISRFCHWLSFSRDFFGKELQRELKQINHGSLYIWFTTAIQNIYMKNIVSMIINWQLISSQVLLEQVTSSPWNNFVFMLYYGLVIEGEFVLILESVAKIHVMPQFFWMV